MAKDYYSPDTIRDIPIPTPTGNNGAPASVYNPGESAGPDWSVKPIDIPSGFIADEVISASLDTQQRRILGSFTFGQVGSMAIGQYLSGGAGIILSPNGIAARNQSGETTFTIDATTGDATFKGTIDVGSIITGYIAVGGAANDVNNGSTVISGGKIETGTVIAGSVVSNWIYAGSINAGQINAGTINGIAINAGGSGNQNGVIRVYDSSGNQISELDELGMQIRGFHGLIMVDNINGSLEGYIGYDGGSQINIAASSGKLLQILSDSDLVLNSRDSSKSIYIGPGTTWVKHLNFGYGQSEGSMENVDIIKGYNDLRLQLGTDDNFKFLDDGGNVHCVIYGRSGKITSDSTTIRLNGVEKSAIVPIKDGYTTLYCAEAPEVWFFDFFKQEDGEDPLFTEVTEGKRMYVTMIDDEGDTIIQVWRRRKGHAQRRFEIKTAEEFQKNEALYMQAR